MILNISFIVSLFSILPPRQAPSQYLYSENVYIQLIKCEIGYFLIFDACACIIEK